MQQEYLRRCLGSGDAVACGAYSAEEARDWCQETLKAVFADGEVTVVIPGYVATLTLTANQTRSPDRRLSLGRVKDQLRLINSGKRSGELTSTFRAGPAQWWPRRCQDAGAQAANWQGHYDTR
jgi:hypothetical protein